MNDKDVTLANTAWREKIEELKALLAQAHNELIEAETELAEQTAAINTFDFKLRARIGHLVTRLEAIQAEINQFRQQLRQLQDDWDLPDEWEEEASDPAARQRFREWHAYRREEPAEGEAETEPADPPPTLDPEQKATLRQLYRQLARRFHPDLAVDTADRDYRTNMMAAVNAAYKAGDVDRLRALMDEPEAGTLEHARSDEQLIERLQADLRRCHRRLAEIRRELTKLEQQQSSRLLRRAQKAEAEGRDFFTEITSQLKAEISRKMVERDAIQAEIEELGTERSGITSDRLAELVYDFGLEFLDEDFVTPEINDWLEKRQDRYNWDEDILDDSD
jgi:chromosome segregation ATPase